MFAKPESTQDLISATPPDSAQAKVLAIDLGTSYFKVCLFDNSLRLLAHQRVPAPVEMKAPGRCEMPVPAFERCIAMAVLKLARAVGSLSDVKLISFASQANSFTFFDDAERPLAPFVLWTDQRAGSLPAEWSDFTSTSQFRATTGVASFDHHFMLPKVEWFRQDQPEILENARHLCGMSDYLVRWLTGRRAAEAGLAGLTGLLDIRSCEYWDDALRYFAIPKQWLPPIVRAGSVLGRVRSRFVETWSLPQECRVVMGCLDQYAGAFGAGVFGPGDVCETTGTVLATVTCARDLMADSSAGVFQGPTSVPGLYYRMIFSRVGAGLLETYRNQLPDRPNFDELDALAESVPPGCNGLALHPSAPDFPIEGWFIGRQPHHDRGHEVRTILEAVAKQLKRQIATMCGGITPNVVRSVGGAARSRVWMDIKRRELGCQVEPVNCLEATSLGAAKLALCR